MLSRAKAKNRREKLAWSGWALCLGKGKIFRLDTNVSPSNSCALRHYFVYTIALRSGQIIDLENTDPARLMKKTHTITK